MDTTFQRIPTPERTLALIEKEVARADRFGTPFSLLTLYRAQPRSRDDVDFLVDASNFLSKRLRLIDDFGLVHRAELGILLPATNMEGACVVRAAILEALREKHPTVRVDIDSYPDDWSFKTLDKQRKTQVSKSIDGTLIDPMPAWKRTFDICFSGLALLFLLPIFFIIGMVIRISSPGPIFYTQRRTGLGGRPFSIYKFRSMKVDADQQKHELVNELDGPAFKVKNDPRVTKIGRLIRKTSLDELPQLWNVLCGDMSIVGPRPLPCDEAEQCKSWQRHRLRVTPGITCIWQVSGRNNISFGDWMRMDIQYARQRSFVGDMSLILRTFWVMLVTRDGC